MPIHAASATVELTLAHRAIQESQLTVQYGMRDLSRLRAEIRDLRHQINMARKVISETRAFLAASRTHKRSMEQRLPR
jgi:hypothetical protein